MILAALACLGALSVSAPEFNRRDKARNSARSRPCLQPRLWYNRVCSGGVFFKVLCPLAK